MKPNSLGTDMRKIEKRRKQKQLVILYLTLFVFLSSAGVLVYLMQHANETKQNAPVPILENKDEAPKVQAASVHTSELEKQDVRDALLKKSQDLAVGYDYDGAIKLLKGTVGYENFKDITNAIATLEKEKSELVPADILKIPHIFFHPLIYDTNLAFKKNDDSTSRESLNTAMTTVKEFNEILSQLYKNGYVLVSIHDAATPIKTKSGKMKLKPGKIMLPEGKKPIIISEDDVNYYEKWHGKGVASRLIIDANGKPSAEVDLPDGTTIAGDYDVAPLLERFIEKHPDFSYKGARAILAVTGREGVWGYRTSKYVPGEDNNSKVNSEKDFNIKNEESKKAKAVSQGLRNAGYDLASHSFVHEGLGHCSMHLLKYDTKRWENECESLLGKVDIMIYPKGEDIEHGENAYKYVSSNARFTSLSKAGFLYYCNVDGSNPYWTIMGNNYYRQARIALDGNVMYYQKKKLKQFFGLKVSKIWDSGRPKKAPLSTY